MSFGRPGALSETFKVSPPQRGSFPLDHDGECKEFMLSYMSCLKAARNDGGQCRPQAKAYLECRMDKGLMGRDDFQNLGLGDVPSTAASGSSSRPSSTATAPAAAAAGDGQAGGQAGRQDPPSKWTPAERI